MENSLSIEMRVKGGHLLVAKVGGEISMDECITNIKKVIESFTKKPITIEPDQTITIKVT